MRSRTRLRRHGTPVRRAGGVSLVDNIVTFVRFQLSTNIGAILTLLAAVLAGLPAPMSAIQLLWVNIIMDASPAPALS
ncbi:hypothetical protein ACFW2D_36800 [Streptomyces sp. NPDC058914]|uniref:hypothetical protein n=1 Tax=Streptomyces sp. NPDC058914 TaxID=3346671 RepID=UPI0036B96B1B